MENTLLIIGNGFDLQSGLASRYEDFFIWLKADCKKRNDNFWSKLFTKKITGDIKWVDVESEILNTLMENLSIYFDDLKRPIGWGNYVVFNEKIDEVFFKYLKSRGHKTYLEKEIKEGKAPSDKFIKYYYKNSSCLQNWYLEELKKFEIQFIEYLEEILKTTKKEHMTKESHNNVEENYFTNCYKLISEFIQRPKHGISSELRIYDTKTVYEVAVNRNNSLILNNGQSNNIKVPQTDILSFNYTSPLFDDKVNKLMGIRNIRNVHGDLENRNIIFGVDTTAKDLPRELNIFTKTYRKMLNKAQLNSIKTTILNRDINIIKVYGHSLGKADYSYFQSIFDFYNLYGDSGGDNKGYIQLQFYFSVYNGTTYEKCAATTTENVHNLITSYGNTLDNKDKGKNLLHKLLLENRLHIIIWDKTD